MNSKIIKTALIFLIFLSFGFFLIKNFNFYQQKFDFNGLNQLYQQSQFAEEEGSRKFIIEDHDLYAYAGYQYLTSGEIDQINIEHPPLGKYLIGLSISLFKNQNIGQTFWGIVFIILLYKVSFRVLKNKNLSLLLVLLFLQEKIFQYQLTHSLLDLPLGVFLLIFLINFQFNPVFAGLSLGTMASIKYPTTALIAWLTMIIYFLVKKGKKMIQKILISSLIALLVFLSSYAPFFVKNNPFDFYHLQIKALKIHLSHVPEYPKAQVFNVLLFNRWLTWWGEKEYIKTEFWNFLWPLLTLNFGLNLLFFRKIKNNLLIKLWSLIYLLFLSWRLFFPRYLFLLLPFLYLQLFLNISKVFKHVIKTH